MSECRRTVEQLAPYVDGTLTPPESADVDRHLAACPPCRRTAEAAAGGHTVLRRHAGPLIEASERSSALPPGLRSRCEALARAGTLPAWRRHLMPAVAVAALVLATGLAVFSMASRRSEGLLVTQLALDHMKCFHFASGPPIGDAGAAEGVLADRYGWDIHVPPSSPRDGVSLVGVRRCLYAAGTMPHLMYRVNGHDMSLFVLDRESRPAAAIQTLGHASRIWSRGATTYVLVAPEAAGDLSPAVRYVMQHAP